VADAADGGTMEIVNPATGELIAYVPRSSEEDVERAVQAAKSAGRAGQRGARLLSRGDRVEIASVLSKGMGSDE
jgi:acyl-CoA reductase-like NAD-dependent aldehyde dehydrogenase